MNNKIRIVYICLPKEEQTDDSFDDVFNRGLWFENDKNTQWKYRKAKRIYLYKMSSHRRRGIEEQERNSKSI